ncbi:MAG: DUF5655 domain-containing protein [Nitrososphaerales archaeon]
MDKFGLYGGSEISVEWHLSKMDGSIKDIFNEIRNYVLSLGPNVIEEVRPHRIVYAKSFNFRTFLDIQPSNDRLMVELRSGYCVTPLSIVVSSREQLNELTNLIQKAYSKI